MVSKQDTMTPSFPREGVMPYFASNEPIGDFIVTVQPTGRFRKYSLVRKWIPYFYDDDLKIELSVIKANKPDVKFATELCCITPNAQPNDIISPWDSFRDKTPFKGIIGGRILQDEGIYKFEMSICDTLQKVRGGRKIIAVFTVKAREFIFWNWVIRLGFVSIGVGLALLGQYIRGLLTAG